ncbi:GGDEF domain-containing protein [Noviherbaspirillum pedocola]|uniref:diguanylate cyclase n=1 Tax=Noviherbaspirillum pedocola TaxID=2801341 RepID=A0A934SZU2_9BURK|nr:GGDEF domain-containing protein [Noviherbaspirillum pedocola]MBK4738724.1 GGDEF domain-containing protein [Noviherbaspirillum pedocola]
MVVLNAGAPNFLPLLLGNISLTAGTVFHWSGIHTFYCRKPTRTGWVKLAAFAVAFLALLPFHATVRDRPILSASTLCAILTLCLIDVVRHRSESFSFASRLAVFALLLVMVTGFHPLALLARDGSYLPVTDCVLGIMVVYFAPLAGTLPFSIVLVLLYFEKLVGLKLHLAPHEELTGLMNRRAIMTRGRQEIELAVRTSQPVALAYLDIDHFKSINDDRVHKSCNGMLARFADLFKKTCRTTDLASRYGGEEFCVMLPSIRVKGASPFGQRLLEAVHVCDFHIGRQVTVSIRLVVWTPLDAAVFRNSLIRQADLPLYEANRMGRDRFLVHVSSQDLTPGLERLAG